jgi:hypothetical protein
MPTKDELVAKAEGLGLEVTRADGKSGAPTVADYERVLEEHGAGIPATVNEAGIDERTYLVGGPYRVFGKRRGETVTGVVERHADTDDELFIVGADYAVLKPLLEAKWLRPVDEGKAEEEEG